MTRTEDLVSARVVSGVFEQDDLSESLDSDEAEGGAQSLREVDSSSCRVSIDTAQKITTRPVQEGKDHAQSLGFNSRASADIIEQITQSSFSGAKK